MEMHTFIKLGISAILGLIIGLERELKRKPVGLKTCLVISIVSCLLTIVSIESAYIFPKQSHINMDPLRLAAQIVSGIGFLGAGVILRRGNDSISGLTTAALIWGAAGMGVAVGAGFYVEAIIGVILLIASVEFIPLATNVFGPKQLREKELFLKLIVSDINKIAEVIAAIKMREISIKTVRIKDLDDGSHLIELKVSVDQKRATTDVYYSIHHIPAVRSIDIENI
ncbi:putative Mg2+ transporter-C (MgtC) family protein [Thermolongibacillus altinsuensis]|jgi:putative Mg2+ transporter-C (MgtC) family protein|uniref:Putative Mg2+ transporter-C (MgtC) family protein n=1 Tax=Thermolongibacillus altinsuensis TaxID=575256 RepID=A0A4R1QDV2_9BACL|nr:MgtC/SapB family protein [Thermolongibacillus altinsuensis]TCL47295.1 putative Mg2+ transporter-C (MgtC) family protein [Thermolongibacillus altinsuensis]GMB08979.1 methyltransferase [Thermolongibacillus altinsuensis]